MFLEYGVNEHGELIHIDQAGRGLTNLTCPYCGGQLLAKKGSEKIHHFAHIENTCNSVGLREDSAFRLPFYDKFDLGLSPSQIKLLAELHEEPGDYDEKLFQGGFIKETFNPRSTWYTQYAPTHLGKIPLGATTLEKFAEIQDIRIMQRYQEFEKEIYKVWKGSIPNISSFASEYTVFYLGEWEPMWIDIQHLRGKPIPALIPNALTDLNIYRAQLRRVFAASLYFLEIKHSGGILYKVGVTSRNIEERIDELKRDIAPYLSSAKISILRQLRHRGSIEFYFKHRYRPYQQKLGKLSEYFAFENRKNVLSDISKLGDYEPDNVIRAILNNEPSKLEREIEEERQLTLSAQAAEAAREARSHATKVGMQRAAEQGIHVGRPPGSTEDNAKLLAKYPEVVSLLEQGKLSLRDISYETGVAVNTIRKVKTAMEESTP